MRRLVVLALLLLVTTSALATRSFTGDKFQRVKLVERATTPVAGSAVTHTDAIAPLVALGRPLAFIARIHNAGPMAIDATISSDGHQVCAATIAASATARVDCQGGEWESQLSHTVSVETGGGEWTLNYLELATHHGNSDGLLYFVIAPNGSMPDGRPGVSLVVTFGLIVALVLGAVPPARMTRWGRRLSQTASTMAATVLALSLLSPWVSPYLLLLSAGTVVRCTLIVAIPQLLTTWRWLRRPSPEHGALWRPLIVAGVVALGFGVVVRTQLLERHSGNYSGFLLMSRAFFEGNPLVKDRGDMKQTLRLLDDGGYDGQFAYYVALDPLMRAFRDDPRQYRSVVDAVPYRYGRIGFSVLAGLLSGGRWQLYPQTMLWLLVGASGVAAFCLALMAQDARLSPLLGGLILLVPGFWQSIQSGLPEPVAAALLVAGCLLLTRHHLLLAACCLGGALLVRETGLIVVGGLAAKLWFEGRRREAVQLTLIAVVPMACWRLYVGSVLYPDWGLRGFLDHPADLGVPFQGFMELWQHIAAGDYYEGSWEFARAGIAFPVLLTTGLAVALALVVRVPTPFTVAACGYAAIAVCLNYSMIWVHVGNGQRGTFELFVTMVLSVVAYRTYPRPLRVALVLFWVLTASYTVYGAFDAASLREAAWLPI